MASGYHDGSRSLQDRFDTRALADRIDSLLVSDTVSDSDRAFIEARDMFFLATADAEGSADVLVQGRRTRLRPGARPAHHRVPELRRQRHVPLGRQRAGQPRRRDALHRLRARPPDAARGHRDRRPRRPLARRLPRGPVRGAGPDPSGLPELPEVHPPLELVRRSRFVRAPTASPRYPSGSGRTGPATPFPSTTRHATPGTARCSGAEPRRRRSASGAAVARVGAAVALPATGAGSTSTRMPARGAGRMPTTPPTLSAMVENRAWKPYFATTARRTEATSAASRTTRAVPRKVGAPGSIPPRTLHACSSTRSVWASRFVLPVSSTLTIGERPGLVERRGEPHRGGHRNAGAAERGQGDVPRRGQRVVSGTPGRGTGVRLVHGASVSRSRGPPGAVHGRTIQRTSRFGGHRCDVPGSGPLGWPQLLSFPL